MDVDGDGDGLEGDAHASDMVFFYDLDRQCLIEFREPGPGGEIKAVRESVLKYLEALPEGSAEEAGICFLVCTPIPENVILRTQTESDISQGNGIAARRITRQSAIGLDRRL